MGAVASQITSLTIVYWTIYSGADQRKHQSSASLAFVREFTGDRISPHKGPVTRKMFQFDDVIMKIIISVYSELIQITFYIKSQTNLNYISTQFILFTILCCFTMKIFIFNESPKNQLGCVKSTIKCHQQCQRYYIFPEQNDRYFGDDIFKCTFMNETFCISSIISLKFVGPNW